MEETEWPLPQFPKTNIDGKLFGWSPDGGYFVRYQDKTYWETGQITTDGLYRIGFITHDNDYTLWSDEHRARVLKENEARWAEAKIAEDERRAEVERLVKQAEAKLTEEEIQAMAEHYRY